MPSKSLDLSRGFQVESPSVVVPWEITEAQLIKLFGDRLKHVTQGYFTIECESLGGLKHLLGFHFQPRSDGRLKELEFFRSAYPDMKKSFDDFQSRFESAFGKPTRTVEKPNFYPAHFWNLPGVTIVHEIIDRFGEEEHMRIVKS